MASTLGPSRSASHKASGGCLTDRNATLHVHLLTRSLLTQVLAAMRTDPSDWQDYWGSSNALLEDIAKIGKDKFRREILFYCQNRAECNYIEAREQFARKVLESDRYYNGHIRVRVHKQIITKEKAST